MNKYYYYLELFNKMKQVQSLCEEMHEKKISELSDETINRVKHMSYNVEYDEECDITDYYLLYESDEVFELFEEMCITDDVVKWNYSADLLFELAFYHGSDRVAAPYYAEFELLMTDYENALNRYKEWADEDQEEGGRKRLYNILVIEESQNEFGKDTETDEWVYCWQEREIIRTDFEDKLHAKVVEIQENANKDYYQTKIFIDLNSGEEVILFNDQDIETERTDRATFYLRRLGLDT